MSPQALKFLASGAFGVSAMMLCVVIYQLLRSDRLGSGVARDPSQRRADKRRRAIERSPLFAIFLALLQVGAAIVSRLDLEVLRRYIHDPYLHAGYPGGLDDDEVVTLGLVLSFLGTGITIFLLLVFVSVNWSIAGLAMLPMGFLALMASLKNRADQRQRQILTAMPYVLDLLVLVLRSGTSLNIALARVVGDYRDHPVGEELGQMLSEIEMGALRTDAVQRLADRVDHMDISALAESMIQSEELGWPLADTLERQANRMAAERVLAAQAKAGAAGVWVMIPSTLVLVGAVLLLFGPLIVRYMQGGFNLK